MVEFDHVSCFSVDGLEETCLHEYDCQKIGGITMGACADGYGTCCVSEYMFYMGTYLVSRLDFYLRVNGT